MAGSRALYNVDPFGRLKPEGFEDHLTVLEVIDRMTKAGVPRDRSALARAEKKGHIPAPVRVKVGQLQVRLYSLDEAAKIVQYFKSTKPGRKPKEER